MKQSTLDPNQIDSKGKENKIIISSIRLLFPNLDKTYYLNITINETKPMKTNAIEFKGNTNQAQINQSFKLPSNIVTLDKICFQLFEKVNIFSSPLYKGEVKGASQVRDDHSQSLICYLKNNNNEDFAVIYYNFEFQGEDLFQKFVREKKTQENDNQVSILDLSMGNQSDSYSLFISNLDYIKSFIIIIEDILHWKNYWKTLGLLFMITFGILSYKLTIVFGIPMGLIFLHLMYKDKMKETFLIPKEKFDKEKNIDLFHQGIAMLNNLVFVYENMVCKLSQSEKQFTTEVYLNLIKMTIWGFIIFYTPIYYFISVKYILLTSIWIFACRFNPTFHNYYLFITRLVSQKLSGIGVGRYASLFISVKVYIFNLIYLTIPFLQMLYPYDDNESNNTTLFSSKANFSSITKLKKFEIYENERWWMFIGWTKNVLMNDKPLWCNVNDQTTYCDMNQVFLPNGDDYKWAGDWKVERTDMTDTNGWEYSDDFNSPFCEREDKKYVRRRKWVRYAIYAGVTNAPGPAKD